MAQMRHLAETRERHQQLIRLLEDSCYPREISEPVCNGLTLSNGVEFCCQVSAVQRYLGGILDRNEKTCQQLNLDALRLKRQAEASEQRLMFHRHRRSKKQLNRVLEEAVCRWGGDYD